MLKIEKQENLIMLFFVVLLVLSSIYIIFDKSMIDIVYFGVVLYYFIKFLVVKHKKD